MRNNKTSRGFGLRTFVLAGIAVFLVLAIAGYASALAVSMPYLEDKKTYILPGAYEDMTFVVQNDAEGDYTIGVKPNVLDGEALVGLTDGKDVYEIPAQNRADVHTRISIPADAKIGTVYPISIDFESAPPAGATGFNFGSAIRQSFSVVVGDSPQTLEAKTEARNGMIRTIVPWVIIAAIIGIVGYFVVSRRKKSEAKVELIR